MLSSLVAIALFLPEPSGPYVIEIDTSRHSESYEYHYFETLDAFATDSIYRIAYNWNEAKKFPNELSANMFLPYVKAELKRKDWEPNAFVISKKWYDVYPKQFRYYLTKQHIREYYQ